jgi:tonB-dependent receptor hmuR
MQVRLPFNITLRGAYSYVNDDATIDGRRYSMIRPHTVVLGANYNRKFGKFLITGGLNGRWLSGISYWSNVVVGGKKSLVMSYFEPQMIWKLNMGCFFPRGIRLNVGIDNLFNNISKNVSNDPYSALSRGMELIANLSVNIAELVGI